MHFYSLDDLCGGSTGESHDLYPMRSGSIGYEISGAGDYGFGLARPCARQD
jgi:hypothetical protein